MHPALSVIFFTVVSGAGYGLFMVVSALGLIGFASSSFALLAVIVGLVMVTLGLSSSTLHLANPKNAWRAFSRFRSSWLSREGVLAVVYYLPALLYGWLWWQTESPDALHAHWAWTPLSLIIFLGALLIVFSTGMIYACLKTIRQWHTAFTPINYMLISLMHGALLSLYLYMRSDVSSLVDQASAWQGLAWLAIITTAIAMIVKLAYYVWLGRPAGSSINTATSFNRATVRLLDIGHSGGNFLTQEFSFIISTKRIKILRTITIIFSFLVPLFIVYGVLNHGWGVSVSGLAFVSSLLGCFLERWLFFAEARHVVNLYHGAQHT